MTPGLVDFLDLLSGHSSTLTLGNPGDNKRIDLVLGPVQVAGLLGRILGLELSNVHSIPRSLRAQMGLLEEWLEPERGDLAHATLRFVVFRKRAHLKDEFPRSIAPLGGLARRA